jgi:hypothetical protein
MFFVRANDARSGGTIRWQRRRPDGIEQAFLAGRLDWLQPVRPHPSIEHMFDIRR